MAFTLTPVVVTATGTVVSNLKGTARIASFTFSNHGTTAASAVTFWELTSAGAVASSEKFHITLASASLPGSTITQVYNGGDAIKFNNGIYASVAANVVGLLTHI